MSHTHDPSERWGQKREPLCGPDCTYRRLYEGTRLSLSDMASQHASAISAHQHVRNGVIKLLKRVFYSEFQEAERQSGVPMTKVTDEALLLFLESFLTLARDRQQMPHGVEALRASLLARGVEVPNSSDFEAWAEAVRVMPMPQDTDDRLPVIQVDPATLVEVEGEANPFDEGPIGTGFEDYEGIDLGDMFNDDMPPLDELFAEPAQDPGIIETSPTPVEASQAPVVEAVPTEETPEPEIKPAVRSAEGVATRLPLGQSMGSKKKGKAKSPRRKAVSDDTLDVPGAEGDDLPPVEDELRSKLLATVALPRPIFLYKELQAVAGSAEAVEAWLSEMQQLGTRGPVTFIGPKPRHKYRGALLLPGEELRRSLPDYDNQIWGKAVRKYRTNTLYELGVLFGAVGDHAQSIQLGNEVVQMRLNHPQYANLGVVAVLPDRLDTGDATYKAMVEAVEQAGSERLNQVVVLTRFKENLETIITSLRDEADKRQWQFAMPVVAGLSWEWAEDSGKAVKLVLS